MTVEEIKAALADPELVRQNGFEMLGEIARLYAEAEDDGDEVARQAARDLVIRCLERSDELSGLDPVLNSLLVEVGLFPYVDPDGLPLVERLALESHRPLVPPREGFVFHEAQAQVYARLMDGENVILTAPTSFGKTLIVDALIAGGTYANVVVVVPTIALIDEVRRRLAHLNATRQLGYRVITHPGQRQGDRNIFVFTQERLLQEEALPTVDLGVVDEFYKLSLDRDQDRATLLNLALAKLRRTARQLYLLGPSVGEVEPLPGLEYRLIPSLDSTVAVDVIRVASSGDERVDLVNTARQLDEPTLIYVRTPARAHEVAGWLVEMDVGGGGDPRAAQWVGAHFHRDWILVESLRHGIGIHHGRIPRGLAHYLVSAFNAGKLRYLICTQTLIEGVNTTAKNILIVDEGILRQKLDLFTFRNIQGRAGRMFSHFVGRVYLFNDEPQDTLPVIDVPALTQPESAPVELLLGLPDDELADRSRERILPYLEQSVLSTSVLRKNGVDPDAQLSLAVEIDELPGFFSEHLSWNGFPTYAQLKQAVDLLWRHFANARRGWGARSAAQFTQLIWQAYRGATAQAMIAGQFEYWRRQGRTIDDVVLDVLTFHRSGLTFGLPKYLRVLEGIQADVLTRHGLPAGNFSRFAAAAEGGFLPGPLAALDEYGIPIELARRLQPRLFRVGDDLDAVLARLADLDTDGLGEFEAELVEEARRGLA